RSRVESRRRDLLARRTGLRLRTVARSLGAIATRRHVTPATPTRPRGVIEDPSAPIVVADPDALGRAAGQLGHERVAEAGQRVVDRVADVSMVDRDATVGRRHELDDLARVEGAVDRIESARLRGPVVDDRIGDLSKRAADRVDPGQVSGGCAGVLVGLLTEPLCALRVDDTALDE